MRTRLHLISAPWAPLETPSTQLGALRPFVERELAGRVEVRSYSAFLEILYRYRETFSYFLHHEYRYVGEQVYLLIFARRYLAAQLPLSPRELGRQLASLNSYVNAFRRSQYGALATEDLDGLERHTLAYVRERIVPELIDDGVNVVGFTMNFDQVYASFLMARMIRECAPGKKTLFLFGGFSASLPHVFAQLEKLGLDGYSVFGEGEEKLVAILRDLLAQESFSGGLSGPIAGVHRAGDAVDLARRDERLFDSQLTDLDALPLPDYDEYFELHRRLGSADPHFARLIRPNLPLEGSRGCFAKCDFCNLNSQWSGFRKSAAGAVFDKALALHRRYGAEQLFFVDNVCDTWAERFAELALERGTSFRYFLNLRAHHPESFWTKLAAAGMNQCQVGVEALSPPLLRRMTKGTLLVQNLKVLKFFSELGISSGSGIITHHPKASLEDALETERLLDHLAHVEPLAPRRYALMIGSPLYDQLSESSKGGLVAYAPCEVLEKLQPYTASVSCELPPEYRLPETEHRLWTKIEQRCLAWTCSAPDARPVFSVARRGGGRLTVRDSRFGRDTTTELAGLEARIFDACHEGLKLDLLEKKLGLERAGFLRELEGLVERKLVLLADGYYLTLALRPRDECLARRPERATVAVAHA